MSTSQNDSLRDILAPSTTRLTQADRKRIKVNGLTLTTNLSNPRSDPTVFTNVTCGTHSNELLIALTELKTSRSMPTSPLLTVGELINLQFPEPHTMIDPNYSGPIHLPGLTSPAPHHETAPHGDVYCLYAEWYPLTTSVTPTERTLECAKLLPSAHECSPNMEQLVIQLYWSELTAEPAVIGTKTNPVLSFTMVDPAPNLPRKATLAINPYKVDEPNGPEL